MKNIVEKFNALDGKTVSKSELTSIRKIAIEQKELEIVKRIDTLFKNNPKSFFQLGEQNFVIKLSKKLQIKKINKGLNAPYPRKKTKKKVAEKSTPKKKNDSISKEKVEIGLDENGKLLKGYKFVKGGSGKVVKVSTNKKKSQSIKKKNVTSRRKTKVKSRKRASSKTGLGMAKILEVETLVPTNKPKQAAHKLGDAAASVLELPVVAKVIAPVVKKSPEVTSKKELTANKKGSKRLGRKMSDLGRSENELYTPMGNLAKFIGNIEKKPKQSVVVTLDAEQGAGKTRYFFQAMNAYANAGYNVAFLSLEEHPDSNLFIEKRDQYLSEYAKSIIATFGDDEVNKSNIEQIFKENEIIFTDSYGKLFKLLGGIDLDDDIRKKYDGKLFWFIYQRTADGKMRGGSASAFDADIVSKVEKDYTGRNHKVYFNKNRYEKAPGLKWNINTQDVEYPEFEESSTLADSPTILV